MCISVAVLDASWLTMEYNYEQYFRNILPISSINNNCTWSKQVDVYNHAAVFPVVITHFNTLSLRICPVDVSSDAVDAQAVHLQHVCNHRHHHRLHSRTAHIGNFDDIKLDLHT